LKNAANAGTFLANIKESAINSINEVLENDKDYKVVLDWQANRLLVI